MPSSAEAPIPSYLEELPVGNIDPPIETRKQELPFGELTWENFERLCLRLARFEANVEHCQLYGERGENQQGIDLYARKTKSDKYTVYQCKREKNFGSAKIKAAVTKFLKGERVKQTDILVLCTQESLKKTDRADEIEAQKEVLGEKGISFIIWDSDQLSIKLKNHPDIVEDFFGRAWVVAFCGQEQAERSKASSAHLNASNCFRPYIQSVCRHYAEWQTLYTLTDIEGKKVASGDKNKRISPFDFGLMVQSVSHKALEASRQEKRERPERQPVLKGLRDSLVSAKQVLLIGRPGSGKSTALARLLLEEAQHSQEGTEETSKIPVLVELRYYQTSVLDLIRDFFRRHDLLLETSDVETLLAQNRLLLLIDGLNELSSKEAARQDITKLRNYRNVPMVFTTRDLSLGGDFGIEKQWEMLPLTEPQMQAFIRSYLSPEQADSMWRQLKDRTRKFAETPLLLWMLCELFEAGEEIPRNLGEVFRVFTRIYENSSIRKHEVAALKGDVQPLSDRRLWFPALKHLAYVMMQGETPVDSRAVIPRAEVEREFKTLFSAEPHSAKTARDCLDDLLQYHLLQIRTDDEIEFRHQLLQEYYAAEWLLERLDNLSDEQLQYYFLNYLKWTEPISLMLGLPEITEKQAIRIVELAIEVDLMFGARLAGEVKIVLQPHTVVISMQELASLAFAEPAWLKLKLLKKIGTKAVADYLIPLLDHPSSTIRDHAYLTLRNIEPEAIPEQCRVGEEFRKIQKILLKRTPESRRSEEVSPSHPQIVEHQDAAIEASEKFDCEAIVLGLLSEIAHSDPHVRRLAAYNLRILSVKENITKLLNQTHLQTLTQKLEHSDIWVRWRIVFTLWNVASEEVIPLLRPKLEHQDSDISLSAALVLGKFGCEDALPGLMRLMRHPDLSEHPDIYQILSTAAYAFGQVEGDAAAKYIPELLILLPTQQGEHALRAISGIQAQCRFYNYEIAI